MSTHCTTAAQESSVSITITATVTEKRDKGKGRATNRQFFIDFSDPYTASRPIWPFASLIFYVALSIQIDKTMARVPASLVKVDRELARLENVRREDRAGSSKAPGEYCLSTGWGYVADGDGLGVGEGEMISKELARVRELYMSVNSYLDRTGKHDPFFPDVAHEDDIGDIIDANQEWIEFMDNVLEGTENLVQTSREWRKDMARS
ncbi:hypothetical protein IAR50_002875 [Cryptococcus sp. DSM 104548]